MEAVLAKGGQVNRVVSKGVAKGVAKGFTFLSLLAASFQGTTHFLDNACDRLDPFLSAHIVGQELALHQLVDAVCVHISNPKPPRPLIISVHGPPGVGKTFTHTLLARALYNKHPETAVDCPGQHCVGRKVIYGMDFIRGQQDEQLGLLKGAILAHAKSTLDPLIVIEEYDKLDCPSRAMLRQLVQHPEMANATFNRAIVLLESNLGFTELESMLTDAGGDRTQVSMEAAERMLKDLVFNFWQKDGCEGFENTLRLTSSVDFFIAYFPLQRPQIRQLALMQLWQYAEQLLQEKQVALTWDDGVVDFLASKVDFDGEYPLEGAKQVGTVGIRYLARIVRNAAPNPTSLHGRAYSTAKAALAAARDVSLQAYAAAMASASASAKAAPAGAAATAKAVERGQALQRDSEQACEVGADGSGACVEGSRGWGHGLPQVRLEVQGRDLRAVVTATDGSVNG